MVVFKRSISDGIGASSGPKDGGTSASGVGISTRKIGGGGGGKRVIQQEEIKEEKKQQQDQRQAYLQRAAEAKRQYEEQKEQGRRAEELREASREPATKTGVYEKGGAAIQETTGKYETLVTLGKQQPGSRIVQKETGEYALLTAKGLDLQEEATFGKIQENIGLEGGEKYYPTSEKTKTGTKYMARLTEDLGVSGEDFSGAKYSPSYGLKYSVFLEDTLGGSKPKPAYQKTREAQPREIAEMISRGEIPPTFIGYKGGGARRQEVISSEQQGFKEPEVFPITYTTEEGKEIVTITGKSEGAEYNIYQPQKSATISLYREEQQVSIKPESPSKSIERVLKAGVLEPVADVGLQLGLSPVTTLQRYQGVSAEERRKTLEEGKQAYEQVLPKPAGPTPLQNLIETGQVTTGRGLPSDVAGYATEGLLLSGGAGGIRQLSNIKKIKNIPEIIKSVLGPQPKVTPKEALTEEYVPGRYPVSRFPETYPAGELIEFQTQKVKLGTSLVKSPTPKPSAPTVVQPEASYVPGRYPVSRFPETYPRGELAGITETKVPLGVGVGKSVSTSRYTKTTLDLGKGPIKIPGADFTETKLSLGKAAVKTPERIIGRTEGPPEPIREEYGFTPSRLPVSRFPETYPRGELAGITETRIELGTGIGRLIGSGGKPERIKRQQPPKPPSPETDERISQGLILIMKEEPKTKQFTETRVELGRSEKILQIQEGKVIRDTISKTKTKPSESFYSTSAASPLEYEYVRYPPESQMKIKQIQRISPSVTRQEANSLITTQRTKQEEKTSLLISPRTTQKQSQRTPSFFSQPSPLKPKQKQSQLFKPIERQKLKTRLIEVPPEKPPRLILGFPRLPRDRKERKTQAEKLAETKDYLGNVPLGSVYGTYRRKEVTYGDKRISNLLGYERRGNKPKKRKAKKKEPFGISRKFSL